MGPRGGSAASVYGWTFTRTARPAVRRRRRTLFLPPSGCLGVRLPFVVLAALLVAPGALAQLPVSPLPPPQLTVTANDPGGGGLLPGALTEILVVVNYNPGQSGRPAPAPTAERPEATQPTRITLNASAVPSWVTNVSFDPPELLIYVGVENSSQGTSHRREVIARVNLSADAPAEQREPFVVTASAEPNGNIAGVTAQSQELRLYPRAVGAANVTGAERLVIPGGRWVVVEYTVRNDGNSPIVMRLNVTVRPENSIVSFFPQGMRSCEDERSIESMQLESGAAGIVEVCVRTPWTAAEFGALELEATPIVDGEAATPARWSTDIVGESAVPQAGGLPLALAIALAAAVWAAFQQHHRSQR